MHIPPTLLGGLTPAQFLDEYWQKKPLLVRGALPDFVSPLSPEELAGLACEDDVAARLVLERDGEYPWQLRHGPFDEDDFAALPETHWTLLVQEVDRLVPEVARLLDAFRFVPSWRIDDVMVSYAPPHGGVGAHIDNYDVFLLQGLGHRRWQIQSEPVADETLVPDLDVRILADFRADHEWVLGPGDMLYLPPRIAHYGVAVDDCMTYSIGFRAPGYADLFTGFLTHLADQLDPLDRYADPDLRLQENPGEISRDALAKVHRIFRTFITDDVIDRWFGTFVTEPRRGFAALPLDAPYTPDELADAIREGAALVRNPGTRFAYIRHENDEVSLFVGGETYVLDPPFAFVAPLLSGTAPLDADTLAPHVADPDLATLLTDLVNEGFLVLEET